MVLKWPFMRHKFSAFVLQNGKNTEMKPFVFFVIAFDPIKILTCWALQNDRQNLSFVKATNVVGEKRPEILVKWPTPSFVIFISKQSLSCFPTGIFKTF